MAEQDQARRAAATDERQRSTKVTTAVSASAKENTPDLSPRHLEQHLAANTEASPDSPDSLGLTAPEQPANITPAERLPTPGYSRVSPAQATEIVRLKRINPKITYEQIAAAVGVKSIATVSYWLRELDNDTVPEARKLAKTQALTATMKLTEQVDHSDPRVSQGAAKALVALAGVQESSQQVAVGVQVIVGQLGQPAGMDPFAGHNVMVNCDPASD